MAQQQAFVLGDVELIRPLRKAGISVAAALTPNDPTRLSRFVEPAVQPLDRGTEQQAYVARLTEWAGRQPEVPVLFHQTDGDLVMVSRQRDSLGCCCPSGNDGPVGAGPVPAGWVPPLLSLGE